MQIGGLQKLTLIDYPKKIACTIFLFGCNFRCGFCHNPELVLPEKENLALSENEILEFLEKRKKYLDGVCIGGGEPLINPELPQFLEKIKRIGYDIKLDTNGSNPELLKQLIQQGLVDYIAMDIKADKNNYDILAGVEVEIEKIEQSISIIVNSGLEYEFRTTVIPGYHNIGNIKNIGLWIQELIGKKAKKYVIQRFIPRKNRLVDEKFLKIEPFPDSELEEIKKSVEDWFECVEIRN